MLPDTFNLYIEPITKLPFKIIVNKYTKNVIKTNS